ncbi:RDD family protein [Janthinobacterium sp. FW305-128]|uniref:RDD family protein n=1 Tax=Janthinobacterium sp. FW305-128 TaxID=2775055 RepID=UPI001E447B6E|nr:RDD family protein [Janthinobacterium sp. FW305-128]MCC7680793.1 RDD family protein [Janthinobacterium sp. FW305-128]
MQQNPEMDYVGFWPRVGATLIDSLLLLIIIMPMLIAIYGRSYFSTDSLFRGPAHFMISCVMPPLIQLAFWITLSTTPGKMAIGAIIVDAKTGNKPSAGQCVKRCLSSYLSALPLYLGFFWIGKDSRKQGWHDKIADTVVIRRKTAAVPASPGLPLQ